MHTSSSGVPALKETWFGISVVPTAADHRQIVEDVLLAEREGLDIVGIQDHPYQRRFLDTFALIADLQARTQRIRFFPDVANLPMRGATMIAKAAASLDVMSSGRFELGIGAGSFWEAVAGMGGPRRTIPQAVSALEEAIPIIRAALDVGPERRVVRSTGAHYPVPGYPPGPPPAHRVEIWVGAYRPRGLRLIGRLADGWVPSLGYMGADAFREASARIDEAATAAGRDPGVIRRLYNIGGAIADGPMGDGPLDGPPDRWVDALTSLALDLRVDAFIFWPSDTDSLRRYAVEVVPAVRANLARARP
jgi:alkanesulfonate monooxygenase SsuD/methylene tetrahydromethanopterin reductase-like flavin-dependent oxidoreductase (luciferase family)